MFDKVLNTPHERVKIIWKIKEQVRPFRYYYTLCTCQIEKEHNGYDIHTLFYKDSIDDNT